MATYACTSCMHWFRFDQLSEDKLLCGTCVTSSKSAKVQKKSAPASNGDLKRKHPRPVYKLQCKFCLTVMKVKDSKQFACERCSKLLKDYGQPKKCQFCQLESAFIGSKCQRCSSGLKKFGSPSTCSKCGLKCAFDNPKARINGQLLCWLCCMNYHREAKKLGLENNNNNEEVIFEETVVYEDCEANDMDAVDNYQPPQQISAAASLEDRIKNLQQRLSSTDSPSHRKQPYARQQTATPFKQDISEPPHKRRTPILDKLNSTPGSITPLSGSKVLDRLRNTPLSDRSSLPAINDSNIVVVTKLREEIEALKKGIAKKDNELLEKDKQTSMLKCEHLGQIRSLQTKMKNQEDEYLKKIESLRHENREYIRKIAQLSKGKQ